MAPTGFRHRIKDDTQEPTLIHGCQELLFGALRQDAFDPRLGIAPIAGMGQDFRGVFTPDRTFFNTEAIVRGADQRFTEHTRTSGNALHRVAPAWAGSRVRSR
ncbi:MAG: hypothetical protein RSP_17720 [Rhodanobacter sp.]